MMTAITLLLLLLVLYAQNQSLLLGVPHLLAATATYALAIMLAMRFGLSRLSHIEALGLTDSLAKVPNRRALHLDVLNLADPDGEIAVAMIDFDGFKAITDQYGHWVGDLAIKECARLLADICGSNARLYRLGGDEFAIVVTGLIAANILEGICSKLQLRLQYPIQVECRRIPLGASIGLARSTGACPLNSSELLRRADVAMYVSKGLGKGRSTWFKDEFDQMREQKQQVEADIRRGLERGEFVMHYQPLVDALSTRVVAVEALMRWERPDGLRMGPDIFIPIAEETGLIEPMGLWALRQSCQDAMEWDGVKLSVNVSAAQLRNPEFPIHLGQILEETGFPAKRLELEITETYLVGDPAVAGRSLEMVRAFGVDVVLDDFGTGYASIGFLRKFRFEKLKLDRSLIMDSSADMGSRAMLVSSIAVARAMDMDVTAEGIETQAQADMVRAAGCDQMQGWLYYKAVPADEIVDIIANHPSPLVATGY